LTLFITTLYPSQLNLSITSNPSRINPILATDSASSLISDKIFNGLFKYDKDANIVTDLADSFKFIDNRTLIIKLKANLVWHDGKKLDINDVIFTYNSIMSKSIFTPLVSSFENIKSITKIDNLSMKVIYKKPYFKALEIWMVGIVAKHIFDGEDMMNSSYNKTPIGSNSYILKEYQHASQIKLKSFNNYYNGKAKINEIIYSYLPNETTRFYKLKKSLVDIGSLSPIQVKKQLDKSFYDSYEIYERPSFSYTYLGFNHKVNKFKNPKVRELINAAIDKQEIIDILFFGHGKICNGPFLPGTFAYNSSFENSSYNPQKARELLKELGYNKDNPLKFTITTNTGNSIRTYASEIIQYQLRKLGIIVKLKSMEWQAFLNTVVHPRNFEVVLLGWGLSLMPDAKSIWHSKSDINGGFNFVGYKNSKVDTLIIDSESLIDKDKLSINYKKIFKLIVEDNPYVFLYIPNSITAVNKNIQNISSSIIGVEHNINDWIKK